MTTASAQPAIPPSDLARVHQVIHFLSANTEYCLDLQHVVKVLPIMQLRYVPGGPEFLRGLMSLGGVSLPVIDLAERLGLDNRNPYTIDTPILLCADGDKQAGVIVDEVLGVSDVSENSLQMRPLFKPGGTTAFRAAIKTDRGLSLLLDVGQILDVDLAIVSAGPAEDRRRSG